MVAVGETIRFRVGDSLDLRLAAHPATAAEVSGSTVTLIRPVTLSITAGVLCAPGADGKFNPPRCLVLTVMPPTMARASR